MLDLKRYQNVVAFRWESDGVPDPMILAFQENNLEVAELNNQIFDKLSSTDLKTSDRNNDSIALPDDFSEWNDQILTEKLDQNNEIKIKSITLNVTQICNLKCSYCAAGGDGTYGDPQVKIQVEQTLPQLKYFLSSLVSGDAFHISFLGGEPLLYPEGIRAIFEYVDSCCQEKNLRISYKITTNGTVLNQEIIELLKLMKPTLVISLDGAKDLVDKERVSKTGRSTFDVIKKNWDQLKQIRLEVGSIGMHAVFTETNQDVLGAYQVFKEWGFDWFDFVVSVKNEQTSDQSLFLKNFTRMAKQAYLESKEEGLRKIYFFDRLFDRLDQQKPLLNHCGLGRSFAVIDARNRIFNCPWTVGKSSDQLGHGTLLNKNKLESYSMSLIERNDCEQCWAKFLCGGGCSFVHGTTAQKSQLKKNLSFCERTRFMNALGIYYFALIRGKN